MSQKNVLVAQSGGPSPVINASLLGVVEGCRDFPNCMGRVLAAWHGIEGVLREQLLDLSGQPPEEMARLRRTPSTGAIGTCRYKLAPGQTEDFDRILSVFAAHDIGFFFYIGGNDSMDTANRISILARERGQDVVCTGVPKTIDNDVGDPECKLVDHTPGYGSAARYWAHIIHDADEENRGMSPSECVCVLQAMGRKAGFIPAASRLADPGRTLPLQIYMAEAGHTLESLAENVNRQLAESGRCLVVVSEGFDAGDLGEAHDGFGHIEYGASRTAAAQRVAGYLNTHGLRVRGQATWQVPGILQRSCAAYMSSVDVEEAWAVGRHAVQIAVRDGSGWMATLVRKPGSVYASLCDKIALDRVAHSFRPLPAHWISADGLDVTDDFIHYAAPLLGGDPPPVELENGLPRFARLSTEQLAPKLAPYVPIRCR